MADEVEVRCFRPYDFDDEAFLNPLDQFRNALYLPPGAFNLLDVPHYGYVRVECTSAAGETTSTRVVAAPLDSSVAIESPERDPPRCRGALRTNLFSAIAPGARYAGEVLRVSPDRSVSTALGTTHRTYDDEVTYRVCHLSEGVMDSLAVTCGEDIELFNPQTGGRIGVEAGEPHHDDDEVVRVDVRSRQALDIATGDPIGVRQFDFDGGEDAGTKHGLLKRLIGSREMPFNVQLGPDQDEYRNIVRMSEDMMSFLGIDPGDNVILEWRGNRTRSQCLPVDGETDPPNTIEIPSTERDVIDVSVHDAVEVERDMWYVFREQVALSIFGIIGVVIGVLQVVPLVGGDRLVRTLGTVGSAAAVLSVVALLSATVVWLLLIPERQKCRSRD